MGRAGQVTTLFLTDHVACERSTFSESQALRLANDLVDCHGD